MSDDYDNYDVYDEYDDYDTYEDSLHSDTGCEDDVKVGDPYYLKIKPVKMSQSIYGGEKVRLKNMTLAIFCCDRPENPEEPAIEKPIAILGEGEINFHSDGKGGIQTPEGERYYGKVTEAQTAKWARLFVKDDDVMKENHFHPRIDMDIVDFPHYSGLSLANRHLELNSEIVLSNVSFQVPCFIKWPVEELEEKTTDSVDWPTAIGIASLAATIASILVWFHVGRTV